jgi:hypothetical protein
LQLLAKAVRSNWTGQDLDAFRCKSGRRWKDPRIKSWAISMHRDRGVSISILADVLKCSSKTIWSWIMNSRGGEPLTMKGWARRSKQYFNADVRRKNKHFSIRQVERSFLKLTYFIENNIPLDLSLICDPEKSFGP